MPDLFASLRRLARRGGASEASQVPPATPEIAASIGPGRQFPAPTAEPPRSTPLDPPGEAITARAKPPSGLGPGVVTPAIAPPPPATPPPPDPSTGTSTAEIHRRVDAARARLRSTIPPASDEAGA